MFLITIFQLLFHPFDVICVFFGASQIYHFLMDFSKRVNFDFFLEPSSNCIKLHFYFMPIYTVWIMGIDFIISITKETVMFPIKFCTLVVCNRFTRLSSQSPVHIFLTVTMDFDKTCIRISIKEG